MKKKPNVLFVTLGDNNTASSRMRVLQYLNYLKSDGFSYYQINTNSFRFLKLPIICILLPFFNIIFLQKVYKNTRSILFVAKLFNTRIIFDYDDGIHFNFFSNTFSKNNKSLINTMSSADLVIAGNSYLSKIAKKHNSQVKVIFTPLEESYYVPFSSTTIPKTIGWIGSFENQRNLTMLESTLSKMIDNSKYRFVIISNENMFAHNQRFQFIKWNLEDHISYFKKFDLGIMPL